WAGVDLRPFFDRTLRSTDELDWSPLAHVGLELHFRAKESGVDKGGTPPRPRSEGRGGGWVGVITRGASTISSVFDRSPAMRAGVYSDDELVALDGVRVDSGSLPSRCDDKREGDRVTLTVFRRDRLIELPVTLGAKPLDAAYVMRKEGATAGQKAAFAKWLEAGWDDITM
ncbi:MAG: PDZ domain-containing protein, partial [Myxococcaceae bacterium]